MSTEQWRRYRQWLPGQSYPHLCQCSVDLRMLGREGGGGGGGGEGERKDEREINTALGTETEVATLHRGGEEDEEEERHGSREMAVQEAQALSGTFDLLWNRNKT